MSQLKKIDKIHNKVFLKNEPLTIKELNTINNLIKQINKFEYIDDIDKILLNKITLILTRSKQLKKRSHLKLIS